MEQSAARLTDPSHSECATCCCLYLCRPRPAGFQYWSERRDAVGPGFQHLVRVQRCQQSRPMSEGSTAVKVNPRFGLAPSAPRFSLRTPPLFCPSLGDVDLMLNHAHFLGSYVSCYGYHAFATQYSSHLQFLRPFSSNHTFPLFFPCTYDCAHVNEFVVSSTTCNMSNTINELKFINHKLITFIQTAGSKTLHI